MTASLESRVARIEAALGIDPGTPDEPPLMAAIVGAAALVFEVSADAIRGGARDQGTIRARFAAIWTIRAMRPDLSLRQISSAVGRRDHNTILHALKRAREWRDQDEGFRSAVDRVHRIAVERIAE